MKSATSIQDIASHLGLAKSTVSYALRNHPKISAITRERVWQAARELNYCPNPWVTSLMTQIRRKRPLEQGERIAFLSPVESGVRWNFSDAQDELLAGAEERAEELGFTLEVFRLAEYTSAAFLGNMLYHRGIRGLLVAPNRDFWSIDHFPWQHFAAATVGYTLDEPILPRVAVDHFSMVCNAVRSLHDSGLSRVGFVCHENTNQRTHQRLVAGVMVTQMEYPPDQRVPPLVLDSFSLRKERIKDWLEHYKPEALITENQELAKDLRSWGYRIPEDMDFIVLLPRDVPVDFGCISADHRQIGALTVDWIEARLNRNQHGITENVQTTLIDGYYIPSTHARLAEAATISPVK